jgi:hypothetical protein
MDSAGICELAQAMGFRTCAEEVKDLDCSYDAEPCKDAVEFVGRHLLRPFWCALRDAHRAPEVVEQLLRSRCSETIMARLASVPYEAMASCSVGYWVHFLMTHTGIVPASPSAPVSPAAPASPSAETVIVHHGTLERHLTSMLRGARVLHRDVLVGPRALGPGLYTFKEAEEAWQWAKLKADVAGTGDRPVVISWAIPMSEWSKLRAMNVALEDEHSVVEDWMEDWRQCGRSGYFDHWLPADIVCTPSQVVFVTSEACAVLNAGHQTYSAQ